MDDEPHGLLGDDGEILPLRKPKPVEGVSLRTLVLVVLVAAVIAAAAGSAVTLVISRTLESASLQPTSEADLPATIDSIRSTQVAMELPLRLVATEMILSRSMPVIPTRQPTATPIPAQDCYCDYDNCRPPVFAMRRGDSLDSLDITPRDPDKFGWYLVRNLNEISGLYFEVYPSDYRFVCGAPWDGCQFNGYFTTHECVLSIRNKVCDNDPGCRFYEPLNQ